MYKRLLHLILLLITFSITKTSFSQSNFVFIVLDDQGWTGTSHQMDTGLTNSKSDFYYTPEIESFASEAMTFSQGYAPAPKCSPSRCSILTGRSTARNSFTNTDNNINTGKLLIEATTQTALDGNDITYAEWLKATGLNYRTAHFGKWHQGRNITSSPSSNGFDFNDGATSNANGNNGGGIAQVDPKKIFDLTTRSIDFITTAVNENVPFFLQLSHYAVHKDIEARQETIDIYNNSALRPSGGVHTEVEYGAMTEDTDVSIGQLLRAIKSLGIESNTYVILISDNGGQLNTTVNTPLKLGKTFLAEGGIRVPFIIKGPGITANSYNTEPIVAYDLFPTIAELTGSTSALPSNLDGQSIVPLLTGGSFNRTNPLFFHSPHYDANPQKSPMSAAIQGNHKLTVNYETGSVSLYDLSTDIEEENDISDSEQAVTQKMLLSLRDHLKEVNAPMPSLDPSHATFSGTGTDVDNDGLEDAWELTEMLTYTYGPNDDPDGDGQTNLQEYTNNTDPFETMTLEEPLCNKTTIFANETTNAVCFEIVDHVRKVYTNNIPAHAYGPFAGRNTIAGQDFEYSMCLYPKLSTTVTEIIEDPTTPRCAGGIIFGVSNQGVNYSPFARLYWVNPNTLEENTNWHVEADDLLTMDLNGGHVNNVSRYHYHNIPLDYFTNDLEINGNSHSPLLGYAADGFPIYYKYLYTDTTGENTSISAFESGYRLKSGNRPGDGITAPDGTYNGGYVEDYEYSTSLLDECGGRFSVTPEYPKGTYYYVLTDNWPYIPRCLKGSYVDNSFLIGPNCPDSTAIDDCSQDLSTDAVFQSEDEVVIYPNPTNDYFKINLNNTHKINDLKSVKIYKSDGAILYQTDNYKEAIQISNFVEGIYYIQMDFVQGQVTKKLIIKN
jgi:arylsulfatase A-like enzyme